MGIDRTASIVTSGAGTNALFTTPAASIAYGMEIDHLGFAGSGKALLSGDMGQYWAQCHFHHNDFWAELSECVYANLIEADISHNRFGWFGTVGAQHRHIYSAGDGTYQTNLNVIRNNQFYRAVGCEAAVSFDRGFHLTIEGNDFESNSVRPIDCLGMYCAYLRENWFETNACTYLIRFANDSGANQGNLVIDVAGNWIGLSGAGNAYVMDVTGGQDKICFDRNAGTNFSGKYIASLPGGHDVGFSSCQYNHLVGYA